MDSANEIIRLLYRYAECVDAGDFEGVGALLAHAQVTDASGQLDIRGADAIRRLYEATTRRYPETGTPRTRHLITNPQVEVDEATGRATCRAHYTVLQQTQTLPLQPILTGHYEDAFERVDGRWRITGHRFFVDLVGDVSQHLLIDLPAAPGPARD